MHRRVEQKKLREILLAPATGFSANRAILDFMLRTSMLEFKLKAHVRHLLAVKAAKWDTDKKNTADMMAELADYFSGKHLAHLVYERLRLFIIPLQALAP